MCGFAGTLNVNSNSSNKAPLNCALSSLVHRGPDGEGKLRRVVGSWEIDIGHRRLKIIDLDDRAAQPFCRENIIVLFNGELYNYIELRNDLQKEGICFVTESDTEVLAAAFQHWGSKCFQFFDGMYAVVLIDCHRRKVLFARDPFGEKPLYLSAGLNEIAFGSTADSVLAFIEGAGPCINYDWLDAFLHLGFAPAPMTIWHGIEKVAAGEIRELDLETGLWTSVSNASHMLIDSLKADNKFNMAEFESLLTTSIERRLRADVPVALLLSGGIDSTYIAALIRNKLNWPLVAVTIHDRVDSNVEIERAARICTKLGIEHLNLSFPKKSLNELIGRAITSMDEPISDPAFPLLVELLAQIPPIYRVILTGDGGDELFLSYGNYRRLLEMKKNYKTMIYGKAAKTAMAISSQIGGSVIFRAARRIVMDADLPTDIRFGLLLSHSLWGKAHKDQWYDKIRPRDEGALALWRYSLENELPEYLLVKTDRASMHFSLESRAPYLSRDLFRYVLSCDPASMHLGVKIDIIDRLNEIFAEDMGFTKRGFFASGQKQLVMMKNNDWHPLLLERFKDRLVGKSSVRRIDATIYYRLHILNSWLKLKCA